MLSPVALAAETEFLPSGPLLEQVRGDHTFPTLRMLALVFAERRRQQELWGPKGTCASRIMGDGRKYLILGEEFGEVGEASLESTDGRHTKTREDLKEELIQLAAVAVAWAEAL